ncbi:hypothetical protein G6F68_019192 [Rhizopus microsporus]|uniref:Uncharacterized protein n=1 Tax=Rhizopus delemar TaxID=936053 RepID=A0A9P6XQ86_9FUNG|nr:hypothetical protein G6F68_019192 [Rhizopus microsporus]KAG1530217.1 hypothetical protein G6F50_017467 [Rhizopus delemar]
MQDSDDRARRASLAQGLHGDLAELNRLVSELLAYERLEHPNEGESLQRIEANDWLQACLADARRDAERAGLALPGTQQPRGQRPAPCAFAGGSLTGGRWRPRLPARGRRRPRYRRGRPRKSDAAIHPAG